MLRKSLILVSCLFVLALAIIGCGGGGGSAGNPTGPALVSATTASLSGTVLFNNAPIPFASVHLYKSDKAHTVGMAQLPSLKGSQLSQQIIGDDAYSTTTNAEGVYNFVNIPVGQYTLIAVRDENHQFVQTGVLLGQVTTLNPQLTPTGKITGKVTLSIGGTPQDIAGAFVYINGTSYIAVSDTAGNFTINNVPSNALTTSAAYEILVSSTRGTASPVTGVVVNPGATTNIGTIAMTAPAQAMYTTLNGTLVPGKGVSSVGGLFVVLTHQTSGSIFGTHTDASGNYQFRVVESGNFLVICPEKDYNFTPDPLIVQIGTPNNETLTLSPITVDAGQTAETGSIIGTVVSFGSPFAGAIVHITGTSLLGISNSNGNFIINNVPVNTSTNPYTLELSASKGTAQAKTGVVVNVGQATDVGAFDITEPTTGYKNVVGTLTAVAPVTAADLVNRLVQLTGPDGKVLAAYSDVNGAFSFLTTQSGVHTATVMESVLAYAPRTQTIDITVLDNGTQALTSIINVTNPNIDNKLRVNGVVFKTIKVKPETDNSGVSLKLDPEAATEQNLFTFSRADGSFEFFVVPGTYTLTVEGLYQLDPPTPITINVTSPYTFAAQINVRPAQTVNSIVSGSVDWPTVAGWNFTEGEVILEGTSFVDHRIVSNVSPALFRFENVPPGSYVLKSNPLRNGYSGSTAAFTVTEGTDLTGQSLVTSFIAPLITSITASGYTIAVAGQQFGTMASMQGYVSDKPLLQTSTWDANNCYFDVTELPPGEHSVQLIKDIPGGRLAGNKKVFTRPILAPLLANFVASSTDTTITFTWQNEPYVTAVDIRLLQGAAVVRPIQRIFGSSFTYENLLPNTSYTIEVVSTYQGVPNSPPTAFNFATKQFSASKPALMTLAGSVAYAGGYEIFGFELMNDKTYVAYRDISTSGSVYVKAYDNTGAQVATYSTSFMTESSFDLCAGGNSLYLLYYGTSGLGIQKLTENLTVATGTALFGSSLLPVSANQAKIELHNNGLFVSSVDSSTMVTLHAHRIDDTISTSTPVYIGSNTQIAATGYWIQTAADELSNDLYLAIATGSTPLEYEILRKPLNDLAASAILITSISSGNLISEFKINGAELIINQGGAGSYYLSVNRSTGAVDILSYASSLESFGTDQQGRLWAYSTGDAYSLVNLVNGQVKNSLSVSGIPGPSREFIKRQIGGTIMPNKFGMLHKKFDGNLGVFYYDGSM